MQVMSKVQRKIYVTFEILRCVRIHSFVTVVKKRNSTKTQSNTIHRQFNVTIPHMSHHRRISLSHVHQKRCHYAHPTVEYVVHHLNNTNRNWFDRPCHNENAIKRCESLKQRANMSQIIIVNPNRIIRHQIVAVRFHRFHRRPPSIIAAIRIKKCIKKRVSLHHPNCHVQYPRKQSKRKPHR